MTFSKLIIYTLMLFVLTLLSCSNIKEVETILQFNEKPENFEDLNNDDIKSLPNSQNLKTEEFLLMMNESTNKGGFLLVKGGWRYVAILYKNGNNKKIRLNCAYGIYQDLESKSYYKIKGDASFGNGLCDKYLDK